MDNMMPELNIHISKHRDVFKKPLVQYGINFPQSYRIAKEKQKAGWMLSG